MAENWYPIINGKCNACMACVIACSKGLLGNENGQINNCNSMSCPDKCEICMLACKFGAINYYDGTEDSMLQGFSGTCSCYNH